METRLKDAKEKEFTEIVLQKIAKLELENEMLKSQVKVLSENCFGKQAERAMVFYDTICYTAHVTVTSGTLVEVPIYTKNIHFQQKFKQLDVKLHIPFTGKEQAGRSRIILFFDEKPVSDSSMYHATAWPMVPLTLEATICDVYPGSHKLSVQACVSDGTLYIPHFNTGAQEATIKPSIFGTYMVYGYP